LNNSVISQSGGNVVINSGNLNIQSGGLLIGGTTVIDSSRNLTGINWVKQNLQFDILRSANSYGLVWSGLTDSYKIYVNETAGSETTNLIIEYADNADQDNVIFRMVPYGGTPKNVLTLRYSDIIVNATFRPLINNLIDLGTSSYQWANIYGVNIYASSSVRSADGSATSPAFTFSSETNTGMYRVSNGIIGFSTGGTQIATISSSGVNIASGGLQIGTYTVIDSSRNADFASLKIGGTNVIDSSRNLVGINQVSQNLNFGGSYSIYNAAWVNATNLNISGSAMVNNLLIYTKTNCGKLYTDSSGNVLCGSDQGITQETDPLWSGNISAITANYVIKRSSTGITASSIYDNGNVGIGTINPLNKLEVVGTTNITSAGTMFYVDANGNVWVKL
jgi:hypothetical protein